MKKNGTWIKYYKNGIFVKELTFDQANTEIKNKIISFKKKGIKQGNRVIVKMKNSPETAIVFIALQRMGAITVPVNPFEFKDKLSFIIKDCNASALIQSESELIIFKKTKNAIKKDYSPKELKKINTIIYTSGTTGKPKGVCLSKINWDHNAKILTEHHNLNSRSILAAPLPLFHCNGHGLSLYTTFNIRCKWILFDGISDNFLEIVNKEKAHLISVVPAILEKLIKTNPEWKPHKNLKYILTAAAPLNENLFKKILNGWKTLVVQGYGLSESTNFSCTMPTNLDKKTYKKIMNPHPSIGKSLPSVNIQIRNKYHAKGSEIGELFINSRSNFSGYWGEKFIHKKWVQTGDLGYSKKINGTKYYYLIGRKKEIINRGGEKISPLEVEAIIRNLGCKEEFAVIAIKDEILGEEIGLACIKKIDWSFLKKLPRHFLPKKIYIVNKFFHTSTGKLQRAKLSEFCLKKVKNITYIEDL